MQSEKYKPLFMTTTPSPRLKGYWAKRLRLDLLLQQREQLAIEFMSAPLFELRTRPLRVQHAERSALRACVENHLGLGALDDDVK